MDKHMQAIPQNGVRRACAKRARQRGFFKVFVQPSSYNNKTTPSPRLTKSIPSPIFTYKHCQPQMSLERTKRAEDRAASETVSRLLKNIRQAETRKNKKQQISYSFAVRPNKILGAVKGPTFDQKGPTVRLCPWHTKAKLEGPTPTKKARLAFC